MKVVSCSDIAGLKAVPAGTLVSLEGSLIALRDRSLACLIETWRRGDSLPTEFDGRVVFFAGPTPGLAEGRGAIGPTTSRRLAAYFSFLADRGIVAIVGKGPLDETSNRILQKSKVCYLQAFGGAGAWYGARVCSLKTVGYGELGAEALFELTVCDFVAMMSLDTAGNRYP